MKKIDKILLIILVLSLLLRLVGIFYGTNVLIGADESPNLLASLKMLGTQSLRANASGYYYPPVLAYLYLPFLILILVPMFLFKTLAEIKALVLLDFSYFIPLARFVGVLLGTGSVYLVYKISKKLFNNINLARLAALLLAINFFHLANSYFSQTWIPQTFFILLFLYWSIVFYKKKDKKIVDYLMGSFILVLSFGVNFVGILGYYWLVIFNFFKQGKNFILSFIKDKYFWFFNSCLALGILLVYYLNPGGLNNYLNRIFNNDAPAVLGGDGYASYKILRPSQLQIIWFYIKATIIQSPVIFFTFIFTSIFLFFKKRTAFIILSLWVLIYYVMVSPLTLPMSRYVLPVIPIMIIISAYGVFLLLNSKIVLIKRMGWVVLAIVLGFNILASSALTYRMFIPDTRSLTKSWVLENIASGSVINNVDLAHKLSLPENKDAINFVEQNFPDLMSSKRRYLYELADNKMPSPSYFVINYANDLDVEYEFIILSDFDFYNLKQKAEEYKDYQLIKSFYPSDDTSLGKRQLDLGANLKIYYPIDLFRINRYYGPYIEIYKL